MKVFISWSGEPSKQIALALRDWLPLVIQACNKKTYMSVKDNEAGVLWGEKVTGELEGNNFGIICLTPGNLESRWIYFEAGALSKLVGQARVVPLLHDLRTADVGLPLSRFQMTELHEDGIREVVRSMNSAVAVEDQLEEPELTKLFNGMWPDLKRQLDMLPAGPEARTRSDRELLEEILQLVRTKPDLPPVSMLERYGLPSGGLIEQKLFRLSEIVAARADNIRVYPSGRVSVSTGVMEEDVPIEQKSEIEEIIRVLAKRGINVDIHWVPF